MERFSIEWESISPSLPSQPERILNTHSEIVHAMLRDWLQSHKTTCITKKGDKYHDDI